MKVGRLGFAESRAARSHPWRTPLEDLNYAVHEGAPIGDPKELVRLASEAGLDAHEAECVLASDVYSAEVRSEEDDARRLPLMLLS